MHWRGGGGGAEGGPFESGEEKEGCSAAGARGGTGTRTAAARRWTKRLQPQFGGVQTGRRVPSDQRGEKLGADDWTVKPVTAAAAARRTTPQQQQRQQQQQRRRRLWPAGAGTKA